MSRADRLRTASCVFAIVASTTVGACASHGPSLLDDRPYLASGATTLAAMRTDTSRTPDAAPAELHDLVGALLDHSPSVVASRHHYRAAIARVPQASTLPRPMVTYTYLPLPVETRVGPNEHRLQLVQAIPFPWKLAARADRATALAEAAGAAHDRTVRDLLTRLRTRWADLYYYERALELTTQNEALAQALADVAATDYAAQEGVLFDVAKARSQLAQLGYDRVRLTELRDAAAGHLNALVGRAARSPITVPAALPLVELSMSLDDLLAVALANQQELRELDARIRAADAQLSGARASWLPDLSVGVQWMLNGPGGAMAGDQSGDDALGVMVGVSLPIWFGDNAARVAEADANLAAAVSAKRAHVDGLEATLQELVFDARNAERLRTLYDEELLPQAIAAIGSAEQWHQADATRFTDLLEARGTYYSFALARERAVADQFKALARLEQLLGASLAPAPEGAP